MSQQSPHKESSAWGNFTRYLEVGSYNFANRQIDVYENGYLTRYNRSHWEDQFGCLADFRFGQNWIKNWSEPQKISSEEFELLWEQAGNSKPMALRKESPSEPPPWIVHFESGKWNGQA